MSVEHLVVLLIVGSNLSCFGLGVFLGRFGKNPFFIGVGNENYYSVNCI